MEEISAKLLKGKYFTPLDASADWHILVDDESSKLLTFNKHTIFGRFRFGAIRKWHEVKFICEFHQTRIKFLSHIITSDCIFCDEDKIKAINEMQYLTNVKELQRLL